jgi:hypothetical protein
MKTRTYADICARQGALDEAIAIYRHLLALAPGDEELRARLTELESYLEAPTERSADASARLTALQQLLTRIQSRRRR